MHTFLPPEPVVKRPRPARRGPWLRLPEDADKRALVIGLSATVVLHLVLVFALPEKLGSDGDGQFTRPASDAARNFNIELAPEEFPMLPPKSKPVPRNFVETNPDVPDNPPDKTDNFAAQNQQAAQEKAPTETGGDRPQMEGRKDIAPTQVVSGNLSPTTPIIPLPPPPTPLVPQNQENDTPVRERNPLAGIEKYTGDNADSFGTNIAKIAPHPEDLEKAVAGTPDAPLVDGISGVKARVSQLQLPRERPKLDKRARPAVFAENKLGTSNIGVAAVDAFRSNYGEYLQKLVEAVQMQFDKLNDESRSRPAPNSMVQVKFWLGSSGEIARIEKVEGGMAGQQAERISVSSITNSAPYGKWTDDMKAMLGEETPMSFTFFWQ